jgi:hypothetical protein
MEQQQTRLRQDKKLIMIALFFVFLSACTHKPHLGLSPVFDIDQAKASSCQLVGEVYEESYRLFTPRGLESLKEETRLRASEIGATHVSWLRVKPGIPSLVIARAYRCEHM